MKVSDNVKDVLLQMGIKKKTGDVESLYLRSYANCITYEKTFKQTKFIENRGYVEYMKNSLIIGNNINLDYEEEYDADIKIADDSEEEEESFSGGLVAHPLLNGKYGIKVFGAHSSNIFNNAVDFDFSSLYPSITIAFNIAKSTMMGKLVIDTNDMMNVDLPTEGNTDLGHLFAEDYLTGHIASVAKRWFGLPDAQSLVIELGEKFSINGKHEVTLENLDDLHDLRVEMKMGA